MSSFTLRLIAVIAMLAGHIGFLFFPETPWFRIIGRIAFPLFAFLIAVGYTKTRDREKYLTRLGIFAVVSQIPFMLFLREGGYMGPSMNILFTLAFGLASLIAFDALKRPFYRFGSIAALALIAEFLAFDYGAYGVILIFASYLFIKDKVLGTGAIVACTILYILLFSGGLTSIQPFALLALPLMFIHSGTLGHRMNPLWFYWFYPLHLLILWVIALIL